MDKKINRILLLLNRYGNNTLSDLETTELELWLGEKRENRVLFEDLNNEVVRNDAFRKMDSYDETAALRKLKQQMAKPFIRRKRRRLTYAIAAAVFMLVVGSGYWLSREKDGLQQPQNQIATQQDVLQGGDKAVLTLANGQTIVLDSTHSGQLAMQGNSMIMKLDSGVLAYRMKSGFSNKNQLLYNTITVPRGGQYQVILPDGTKVWLNAASSVKYPTEFTGKERRITVTGEVYLEVARDPQHPFIVNTRHVDVEVLGTGFNIMAYNDEPAVKITLVTGSVKVLIPNQQVSTVIRPDEQAVINNTGGRIAVEKVNASNVAAWIHGLLSLDDCGVQEFMNQLSRWYNVNVKYYGKIPQQEFGGMINRNARLSSVLSALDAAGIHARLENKTIIVLPPSS